MRTYWLYQGTRVLTAVRLPEGATDEQVRRKALDNEAVLPVGHHNRSEAPFEFANRLHRATVRTFE